MTAPIAVEAPTWSTGEVARMVGVSHRQLDYWLRTDRITLSTGPDTPGCGFPRRWLAADIDRLRQVKARLDIGPTPSPTRPVTPTPPTHRPGRGHHTGVRCCGLPEVLHAGAPSGVDRDPASGGLPAAAHAGSHPSTGGAR